MAPTPEEWALRAVERFRVIDDVSHQLKGPFKLIAAADVYPEDVSDFDDLRVGDDGVPYPLDLSTFGLKPGDIKRHVFPDVVMVVQGEFYAGALGDGRRFMYMLAVGDRPLDRPYFSTYGNDVDVLLQFLPEHTGDARRD